MVSILENMDNFLRKKITTNFTYGDDASISLNLFCPIFWPLAKVIKTKIKSLVPQSN